MKGENSGFNEKLIRPCCVAGLDLRGDNDRKGCVLEPHSYRFPSLKSRAIKSPFAGEFASSLEKQLVWQCPRVCVLLTNKLQRSVTAWVQLPVLWAATCSLWHSETWDEFPALHSRSSIPCAGRRLGADSSCHSCNHTQDTGNTLALCMFTEGQTFTRVTGRPFQHKDPWTLLDAKLMMMKLCLAVTSVIPLSNSKSLPSHRTEEVLKKDLSHFPNSHSKETAETESEQKNWWWMRLEWPFFTCKTLGCIIPLSFTWCTFVP